MKGFAKVITDSTNARIEALLKQLQGVKTSLLYTQKDMDDKVKQAKCCSQMFVSVCDSLLAITDTITDTNSPS